MAPLTERWAKWMWAWARGRSLEPSVAELVGDEPILVVDARGEASSAGRRDRVDLLIPVQIGTDLTRPRRAPLGEGVRRGGKSKNDCHGSQMPRVCCHVVSPSRIEFETALRLEIDAVADARNAAFFMTCSSLNLVVQAAGPRSALSRSACRSSCKRDALNVVQTRPSRIALSRSVCSGSCARSRPALDERDVLPGYCRRNTLTTLVTVHLCYYRWIPARFTCPALWQTVGRHQRR